MGEERSSLQETPPLRCEINIWQGNGVFQTGLFLAFLAFLAFTRHLCDLGLVLRGKLAMQAEVGNPKVHTYSTHILFLRRLPLSSLTQKILGGPKPRPEGYKTLLSSASSDFARPLGLISPSSFLSGFPPPT